MTVGRRPVRVSFSVLLRIMRDDKFVLFASNTRPGAYGPPGGVIKYYAPAARILDRIGFRPERSATDADRMRWDIRGLLPARSVTEFLRWFRTGAYREDAAECLRRETAEELGEVGLPQYALEVGGLVTDHLRTIVEGPEDVPGRDFRHLRRFEVHDLRTSDSAMLRLADRLVDIGSAETLGGVISVDRDDILHGRHGAALIAPHAAFLVGPRRAYSDLPPVR